MKLKFDATQEYQIEAVKAITDLFKGQPLDKGDFELEISETKGQTRIDSSFIVGNNLTLRDQAILKNLKAVQERNNIINNKQGNVGMWDVSKWDDGSVWDGEKVDISKGKHFSVEMETGTGKTYVYLRTIHELHKKYSFKKFVIVVPSIAIKEGVLKNLKITRKHFNTLYENPEMDFYVYDPKKRGQLKNFATNNALQILVINIDSFAKFSESKKGKNIIYQDSDWGTPIKFIQGTKPIVIVDEPQKMETDIRKKAIDNLKPLCTLRYSATHKSLYNLVYKLDPVNAYDLGLVKRIEVDSVMSDEAYNEVFMEIKAIKSVGNKVTAKILIDKSDDYGLQKKEITAKFDDDIYELSGKRDIYKDGYIVNEINVQDQSVTFSNGKTMYTGEKTGGVTDEIVKYQIKRTVQNHFEKEKRLKEKGIKVLSLFFIDRVANYREYISGKAEKGKFAMWFEEAFKEVSKMPAYKDLLPYDVEKLHNGYFSQDKKGILKDTKGNTQADDDTYSLIMKEKEKLLSNDEPLRFIFSHSALREGWDNPNVFQICTLNESKSEMKKRQEIGRGLRLPVNQSGERVFDKNINILTVIANENYEDFAKGLQTEMEEDCGVDFKGRIKDKNKRITVKLKKGYQLDPNFKDLWDKIKYKTRYSVEYKTEDLVKKAAKEIEEMRITAPKVKSEKAMLEIGEEGVTTEIKGISGKKIKINLKKIPDILGYIQGKTNLTKETILKIIEVSGRTLDILKNPQQFMDNASNIINSVMNRLVIDGIKYEKIAGSVWEMRKFKNEELEGYLDNMFKVSDKEKTLYDHVVCDSQIENQFAKDLESNDDIKYYFKLPGWFTIDTPIGTYNPDWALILKQDKKLYFVAETKGTNKIEELSTPEKIKIKCGEKHFKEFKDIDFKAPVTKVEELYE